MHNPKAKSWSPPRAIRGPAGGAEGGELWCQLQLREAIPG